MSKRSERTQGISKSPFQELAYYTASNGKGLHGVECNKYKEKQAHSRLFQNREEHAPQHTRKYGRVGGAYPKPYTYISFYTCTWCLRLVFAGGDFKYNFGFSPNPWLKSVLIAIRWSFSRAPARRRRTLHVKALHVTYLIYLLRLFFRLEFVGVDYCRQCSYEFRMLDRFLARLDFLG